MAEANPGNVPVKHMHESYSAAANSEDSAQTSLMSSDSIKSFVNRRAKKDRQPRFLAVWWKELAAAFLLCASAIASYATLYPYQGKPLPEWPYSITIGALLSTYSVILRLAASFLLAEGVAHLKWQWIKQKERPLHDLVLHDEATRGPLGAIGLLRRLPLPWTWQWLACTLGLVMVLIGPFTQQVLQYDQCSVMVKDFDRRQSQVPRASIFIGQGGHEGAGLNSLSMAEQAAINAGLYTTGQVSPKCSSGNCTVSPYKSIGYCSSCKDVSQDARVTIENTTAPWPLNASDIVPVTIANTSLPNGLSVAFGQYDSRSEMTYDLGVLEALKGIQVLFGAQSQFNQSSTTVGTGDCDHGNWSCQGYGAMDCSLYLCVKSYEGRIINGSFTETVTSQTPQDMSNWNLTVGPGGFDYLTTTLDTSCLDVNERSALQAAGITFNASSSWIPYAFFNASIINGATTWGDNDLVQLERRLLDRGCIYAVNSFFDNGLSLYLNGQMNGTLSGTTGMYGTYMAFNGPQLLQLAYNFGNYSFERTESLVQNISLSFSNYMRLNPGQDIYNSSFPATGDATEMKTCVQVQWAWLMLPTAVALLTLVFFVAILISSHRVPRAVNTWKSSFLPLLFCGPTPPCGHDGDYDDGNAGQDVDSLKDLAKSIKVQLVSDQKGGLRLRERYEGGLI